MQYVAVHRSRCKQWSTVLGTSALAAVCGGPQYHLLRTRRCPIPPFFAKLDSLFQWCPCSVYLDGIYAGVCLVVSVVIFCLAFVGCGLGLMWAETWACKKLLSINAMKHKLLRFLEKKTHRWSSIHRRWSLNVDNLLNSHEFNVRFCPNWLSFTNQSWGLGITVMKCFLLDNFGVILDDYDCIFGCCDDRWSFSLLEYWVDKCMT
jgi:hypothetical protein